MLSNRGRRLTQLDIVPLFATAYNRSATVDSATKGFRITDLWPFDNAVFDAELQAPLQTNPPGGQGPANPPAAQGPAMPRAGQKPAMPPAAQGAAMPPDAQVPGQANPPAVHGPAYAPATQGPANPQATPGPAQANFPAARGSARANPSAAHRAAQANPPSIRDSANPPAIQEPANLPAVQEPANPPAIQDEDEEWPSIVCGEPFGNSRPGEEWVMCISYHRQAHKECTLMQHMAYACHNRESDDDLEVISYSTILIHTGPFVWDLYL